LLFSTVTAVGNENGEAAQEGRNWSLRSRNRRIIKSVNGKIKKKYKRDFSLFQIRKERENYAFSDACGEICTSSKRNPEIKFWFQYKIYSNEARTEVLVSVWSGSASVSGQRLKAAIKESPGFDDIGFTEWDWGFEKIILSSERDEEGALADEIFQALRPVLDAVF
ncbi:MAG: hypothetical protein LBP73_11830, partial [Clostridiales Family XIII bacterium]|nr:hypothetical protein [Clostridiales Family XIII bacterium]